MEPFKFWNMSYYYVYILRSLSSPTQTYIGYTANLQNRLRDHNTSSSVHTRKYQPWQIEIAIRFNNKARALAFERYLKSHSGKAFARKRLMGGYIKNNK